MEKRILIAFILSFFVFVTWSTVTKPPQKIVKNENITKKESQVFENDNNRILDLSSEQTVFQNVAQSEEVRFLENDKLKVEFSNIGGSIKSILFKEFQVSLPVTKIFAVAGSENMGFVFEQNAKNRITYTFTKGHQRITKEYVLSNQDYLIEANVQAEGLSSLDIKAYHIDSSTLDKKVFHSPEKSLFEYSIGLLVQVIRKDNAIEFASKENKNQPGEVSWVGYRDKYFCFVMKPDFKTEKFSVDAQDSRNLSIAISPADKSLKKHSAIIYAGPQDLRRLTSHKQGFENIMVFSNWGILDIFAKMIYFFIHFLYGIFKNWGIAILILGVSLYVVTYPLTAKSMASMRKMQIIQPKMKNLQEKYKKDPQRLNEEMMKLYKENGVNPLGGCLPMLLQMPIFYGLYQVLWRSVDLKGAPFLWIKDLSLPDRLAILPWALPFFGNEFNILPIAMAITMFFQQKFSSQNIVITDENQRAQQKMMIVLMPIMMGAVFYHFASGLSLYFTVFYSLSTLTQFRMSKVTEIVK